MCQSPGEDYHNKKDDGQVDRHFLLDLDERQLDLPSHVHYPHAKSSMESWVSHPRCTRDFCNNSIFSSMVFISILLFLLVALRPVTLSIHHVDRIGVGDFSEEEKSGAYRYEDG